MLILMGDIDIDLMKVSDSVTNSYNDILQSCNLQQHITKPTRITTSYPGSFFGKDPGVGWSRDSQNLGFFK